MPKPLTNNFFAPRTIEVAPRLIGKIIRVGEASGRIVEVEAYTNDPASHAHRRTDRSSIMYDTYGQVYVYFIYGMYHCLNFTTERSGVGAVLIRAVEPLTGLDLMRQRRGVDSIRALCSGPGKLCQAFGIDDRFNWSPVGEHIRLFPGRAGRVLRTTRIGIRHAADLPWRFIEAGNPFISR